MSEHQPQTASQIAEILRGEDRAHARGRGSKTALHGAADAAVIDLSALRGIIEYQPGEYTVTLRAGTPVAELSAALAREGQYLPCDPLLPGCATIGGTVAANLSGPRRFRFGGLRDFILGAEVVDGAGRVYRVGGKVVKNAAGFDLSKFLVGSLGHYAIMTELTFKVFPDAPCLRSIALAYRRLETALSAMARITRQPFELDALDLLPADGGWRALARMGGSEETLPGRVARFMDWAARETGAEDSAEIEDCAALWDPLADGRTLKVVLSPRQIPALDAAVPRLSRRYSWGGNIAWLAADDIADMDKRLRALGLTGLRVLGDSGPALLGRPLENVLSARVKAVLDPLGKLV